MMSAKIATQPFLNKMYFEIKVITSYILSMTSPAKFCHMTHIMDVVMWTKFGSSSLSIKVPNSLYKPLYHKPQFYKDFTRKTAFFEGWSWSKFNNLGLALGSNLEFYTSLSKKLKLKVIKFWSLIPTFVEVTGEKPVGGLFAAPHPE